MRSDLHLHSTASDGLLAPAPLVDALARAGLGACALTDHDTCDGFPAFAAAAAKAGLFALCGAEVAAAVDGVEVHLLSYFREPPAGRYADLLARLATERRRRAERMLGRLWEIGLAVDGEEVLRHPRPGRPHAARAIVAAGGARSVPEAFQRFLTPGGPAYVERWRPPAGLVISAARSDGGWTTFAHPCRAQGRPLQALRQAGLEAIEVVHPSAGPMERAALRAEAERYGLLVTGGSDFHGKPDDPPLGSHALDAADTRTVLARCGA